MHKKIKSIAKGAATVLLSAAVSGVLGYSAINDRVSATPIIPDDEDNIPSFDELEAGAGEIPEIYRDFYYENEYPIALGIYDTLFSEEESPNVPDGELIIVKTDLSKNPLSGTVLIKNNTDYKIDVSEYLTADRLSLPTSVSPAPDTAPPRVLVYHTHGTEGYADDGKLSYKKSELPRSTDITKNVVAVGKTLTDTLNANGIPTIHCEIMHDKDSYNKAYTYSKQTVKEYLEKYPTIEYIFDVHRDALLNSTSVYKVLTYDESTPVAQIMLVVGTDSAGAIHPNWKKNLTLAVNSQYLLTKRLENLVRPISIKAASYNQQYSEGGMLIEIGTCVNTLDEAKASAVILGETLAPLLSAGG